MKIITLTAVIVLLTATSGINAQVPQQQPTYPPQGDRSQPYNDPQLQQQYRVPSSPNRPANTTGQGGQGQRGDDPQLRNADPNQRPGRSSR
jgi:hypothetical protein